LTPAQIKIDMVETFKTIASNTLSEPTRTPGTAPTNPPYPPSYGEYLLPPGSEFPAHNKVVAALQYIAEDPNIPDEVRTDIQSFLESLPDIEPLPSGIYNP
jgi:hypothetical protein